MPLKMAITLVAARADTRAVAEAVATQEATAADSNASKRKNRAFSAKRRQRYD